MQSIVRTGVAILCGFLAMAIVVMVGTVGATALFVDGGAPALGRSGAPFAWPYLFANLGVSFAAALLGGWLASRLDAPGRWRPVIGLALLVLLMSVANQAVPRASSGAPVAWYPWAIVVLGVAGAVAGGWLRVRRTSPPAQSSTAFTDRVEAAATE